MLCKMCKKPLGSNNDCVVCEDALHDARCDRQAQIEEQKEINEGIIMEEEEN